MRTISPRRWRMGLIGVLAICATVTLVPATALADGSSTVAPASYQPDGQIREACAKELQNCTPSWFGSDIYNTTAQGQKAIYYDCCGFEGGPVAFRIAIQNDGAAADRFHVLATGRTHGYKVRFFRGTTDITAAVKAGTYRTPLLAPGEAVRIRAKVWPVDDCCTARVTRLVTLTSVADPTKQDAVRLVRKVFVCTC